MDFSPFNQSTLLAGVTDPEVSNGICVALCDIWLEAIRNLGQTPEDRLQYLRYSAGRAMAAQTRYGRERDRQVAALGEDAGPQQARSNVARAMGHDYEHHTTITRLRMTAAEIAGRLQADLAMPGFGATWSLRFRNGGGHAIAGWQDLVQAGYKTYQRVYHLFDPNLGEYVGGASEFPAMLQDMFRRIPDYEDTFEIRRATT